MKLIDVLAQQAVQDQHSAIRKEFKIPGYEKGFRDGFEKACAMVDKLQGTNNTFETINQEVE